MNRTLLGGLLAGWLGLGSGCALPSYQQSVGWHFEVGTPALISQSLPVQQQSGNLAIGGVGGGPVAGAVTAAGPGRMLLMQAQPPLDPCAAVPYGSPGPAGGGRGGSPVLAQLAPDGGGCTLQDLCDAVREGNRGIQRLEARLGQRPEALPMPKGQP